MNIWLDKTAYNDARYGTGSFLKTPDGAAADEKGGEPKYRRLNNIKIFGRGGLFRLRAPSMITIVLAMLYGGYYAATTHDEYGEVAHQAFKSAFFEITQLWGQIAAAAGIPNGFITSVVEFVAVTASLLFALFAGLGGLIVYAFQILLHI
jgi:hypothetical protein